MKNLEKILVGMGIAALCSFFPVNETRAQATNIVHKPFRGLCYGPFRQGQSPMLGIYPSESQVKDDLTNKVCYLAKQIRTFGDENVLFKIPGFCNQFGIDCYPSAWIDNVAEDVNQVNRLVQIGNSNYPTTKALVVGTEFLYRHPSMESTLTNYIKQVKNSTGKQVTACEQWHIYRDYPNLANSVDILMINIYPFWEQQSIDNAASFALEKYNLIKNLYPGKRIVIGETGWPSYGTSNGSAVPSMENQLKYIRDFMEIAEENNMDYNFFEFSNEPWKPGSNVETNWGVVDAARFLKQSSASYMAEHTSINSISSSNSKINVQTYEGNKYVVYKNLDLATTNWNYATNFTGSLGTNVTPLSLGRNVTTNKNYFLRVRMSF